MSTMYDSFLMPPNYSFRLCMFTCLKAKVYYVFVTKSNLVCVTMNFCYIYFLYFEMGPFVFMIFKNYRLRNCVG